MYSWIVSTVDSGQSRYNGICFLFRFVQVNSFCCLFRMATTTSKWNDHFRCRMRYVQIECFILTISNWCAAKTATKKREFQYCYGCSHETQQLDHICVLCVLFLKWSINSDTKKKMLTRYHLGALHSDEIPQTNDGNSALNDVSFAISIF